MHALSNNVVAYCIFEQIKYASTKTAILLRFQIVPLFLCTVNLHRFQIVHWFLCTAILLRFQIVPLLLSTAMLLRI